MVILVFAHIIHHLNHFKNKNIFLKANLSLLHSEISKIRKDLDLLSCDLCGLHLDLSNAINPSLWDKVEACSALKSI